MCGYLFQPEEREREKGKKWNLITNMKIKIKNNNMRLH